MKIPGKDTRYTYAVSRMRVLETRLLATEDFERILEEEKPDSAIHAVSEFEGYSALGSFLKNRPGIDTALSAILSGVYDFIYSLAHEKELIGPFFKKNQPDITDSALWRLFYGQWSQNMFLNNYIKTAIDLENIKVFFRVKMTRRDKNFLKKHLLENGRINTKDILDLFDRPAEEIVIKAAGGFYESITTQAREEYAQNHSISGAEKACDNVLIEYIKQAKYFHFGVEPLVSYILARENEIKNLRIILIGKINGFEENRIRALLRKSYV
ncbi:MAG: V-type ATPase subunit [Candidatus Omnitrophica bacterium]|nr:V-type ATPase subunit [Candidatus Omnitrophota bacterium]